MAHFYIEPTGFKQEKSWRNLQIKNLPVLCFVRWQRPFDLRLCMHTQDKVILSRHSTNTLNYFSDFTNNSNFVISNYSNRVSRQYFLSTVIPAVNVGHITLQLTDSPIPPAVKS